MGDTGGLTAVDLSCASCGAQLTATAKFCSECGTPVAKAGRPAEYKQVTVLFADVVRSMDIAAALDAERLREVMTELVERAAAVVRRYGGGSVEYTGDGVMGLFGAPVALEDHAFRACLAALSIQDEVKRLATAVQERDGVDLQLRVGLNSGRVIAGEIGSGAFGYGAFGQQVGLAQRMESVAPPGGVMLSESTARLVEHVATLAEPEWVHIKGAEEQALARQLIGIGPRHGPVGRTEASFVGRRWEMAAVDALLDRTTGGRGGVVNVVGPPGIGKSRLAREAAAAAAGRGADVFWTFCESHSREVPFHAVAGLLRAASGVADLDDEAARARIREQFPDADPQDLLLLDDLLGVADPGCELPQIDPDARRRRLTALVNTASLARSAPALCVVEDAHWIDAVSESMLADFLTVVPQSKLMVLVTSRPEYDGALTRVPGAQLVSLGPLGDSDATTLLGELLGSDPSVAELTTLIAERAAGNPFFAEEMVRELVQRGVLAGQRGSHVCQTIVAEVSVPVTVQAAVAARIDRLSAPAKQTLTASSVIGARFEAELLAAMGVDAVFDELLSVEMIEQVRFTPSAEYAFRHPLIHAVAYESQLKSDRAEWHRRLAAAIQEREPESVDENAALIAEHLESAGDLLLAYGWHMRAGAWSNVRDVGAARLSWERACRIADGSPGDDPQQLSMRIAPRTMLCATTGWGNAGPTIQESQGRFAELRELCNAAGDKLSLAIAMTGLATELLYSGRSRDGSQVASEQMALLESIGDPTPLVGLAFVAFCDFFDSGEIRELSRWTQRVVDLAGGDPVMGADFGVASPLALALAYRGASRWWLGRSGWRQDLHDAVAMAQNRDPATLALAVAYSYGLATGYSVLDVDDSVLRVFDEALPIVLGTSNDLAVGLVKYTLGGALLSRDAATDRDRGLEMMIQFREISLRAGITAMLPVADTWIAREKARRGDLDAAIAVMRGAAEGVQEAGRPGFGVWVTGVLVETLVERAAERDLAEAREAIDWLAQLPTAGTGIVAITLLRLRALFARARGNDGAYKDFVSRYRAMAESLGFEGHIDRGAAMS